MLPYNALLMLYCCLVVEGVWNSVQIEFGLIYWRFPQLSSEVGHWRIDLIDCAACWQGGAHEMTDELNHWLCCYWFFFSLSIPFSHFHSSPSPCPPPPPSRPIAGWGGVLIVSLLIGLNADRLKALSLFSLSSLSRARGLELHRGFRKERSHLGLLWKMGCCSST